MVFIENPGLLEIFLFKIPPVIPGVHSRTNLASKPITYHIAQNRTYGYDGHDEYKRDVEKSLYKAFPGHSRHKQQRVPGKKKAHEKAGFCKNNQHNDPNPSVFYIPLGLK